MINLINYQNTSNYSFKHTKEVFTKGSYPVVALRVISIMPLILALLQDAYEAIWDKTPRNNFFHQSKQQIYFGKNIIENFIKDHKFEILTLTALSVIFIASRYFKTPTSINTTQPPILRLPVPLDDCQQIDLKSRSELEEDYWHLQLYYPSKNGYFRLCRNKLKKALWLRSKADHNGALKIRVNGHLIGFLNKFYDLKYVAISTFEDICKQINDAVNIGDLDVVVINAHGNYNAIYFGDDNFLIYKPVQKSFFLNAVDNINHIVKQCFENLPKKAKVILVSCSTGARVYGEFEHSFAGGLAKLIQRTVIAPKDKPAASRTYFSNNNPLQIHHHLNLFDKYPSFEDSYLSFDENGKAVENPKYSPFYYFNSIMDNGNAQAIEHFMFTVPAIFIEKYILNSTRLSFNGFFIS